MTENIKDVLAQFNLTPLRISPMTMGHINESYRVECEDRSYLIQKINTKIFSDVEGLMKNIDLTTLHLNAKVANSTLTLVSTRRGSLYATSNQKEYWRVYVYMEGWSSKNVPDNLQEIELAGQAFGRFIRNLSDLRTTSIHSVLPNFHNSLFRLDQLRKAIKSNTHRRCLNCQKEFKYLLSQEVHMTKIEIAGEANQIPIRITHNDTKFNNVMINPITRETCVVDLETVMPGYIHYDFGDGIRTISSLAEEDEKDLSRITVDIHRFDAFTRGFLNETAALMNAKEIELLPLSGSLLSFLMATRFLTDYLNGDVYYKTQYPEHNLIRARAQIKLTQEFIKLENDFRGIIQKYL